MILNGHQAPVLALAFSADGKRLLSGSRDKAIKVWDPNSGVELLTRHGHELPVGAVAFSADCTNLVSTGYHTTHKLSNSTVVQRR